MKKIKIAALVLLGAGVAFIGSVAMQSHADTVYQPSALFDTQLSQALDTVSTSTMVLQSGVDKSGNSLVGNMCFTVDGGLSNVEYICGSASGTTISNLTRGIDFTDGVTSSSLRFQKHRIGADVKQSDYPYLSQFARFLNGSGTFPGPIQYAASVSTSSIAANGQNVASVAYANSLSFSGSPNGSQSIKGIFQEATTAQVSSGTTTGSTGAVLVLGVGETATTSAAGKIPVANASGTLDPSWLSVPTLNLTTATSTATSTDVFNLLPAGVVQMYAMSSTPAGWLKADGSFYATSSYPRLFTIIGYTYGGSTSTFAVPNFASRQPVGIGQGTYTQSVASTSISGSDITITANDSIFTGTAITFTELTGSLPSALATGTTYYAVSQSATDIRLATTTTNATNGSTFSLGTSGSSTLIMTVTYTSRTIGTTGGQETHVQNQNELVSHAHGEQGAAGSSFSTDLLIQASANTHNQGATSQTANTGSSVAAPVEDPYLGINFIIKY